MPWGGVIGIGKGKTKLSGFEHDMIVYLESPKRSAGIVLKLISDYSLCAKRKINILTEFQLHLHITTLISYKR